MACAQNPSSSPIALLLLSLLAISLSNTNADLVDDVCSKTARPLTCTQVLRSDPRSKTPDLLALGFVAIDVATSQARSGKTLLESLLKGPGTDPKLKPIYASCLENYGDSLEDIENLSGFLKSKDYGSVGAYASSALSGPDTCDGSFSTPSQEPLPLKAASDKLQAICAAVLSINNKLQGH